MTEFLMISNLPPIVTEQIEAMGEVHRLYEAEDKDAFLDKIGARIDIAIAAGGFPADAHAKLPNLKLISSYGVGYDGIDAPLANSHGVKVSNTPDVLSDAVAELTVGMMLAQTRRIVDADAYVRAGRWAKEGMFPLGAQLAGMKVGIFGLGRIGKEVAARLVPMKVEISYFGRSEQTDQPYRYFADLKEMAGHVDWLVSIAPGGAGTHHAINAEVMAALGPEGRLFNIGRGSVVDEAALVEGLKSGALGGAALDVFEDEPNPRPELLTMENVLLQPHNGSATHETRAAMGQLVVDNAKAMIEGRPLLTEVR